MPLEKIGTRYVVQNVLHESPQRTAVVYRAKDLHTDGVVAVKSIEKVPQVDLGLVANEVKILRTLSGQPNIVRFIEEIQTPHYLHIVMECGSRDLVDEFGKYPQGLPEETVKTVFSQLVRAVHVMHSHGIVHRDIKCENILFDANDTIRVCDFGLATYASTIDNVTRRCGTRPYAAPEQLSGAGFCSFAGDIWSLGVVLFAMLSGCLPFREASPICRRYERHVQGNRSFAPWNRFSPSATSLLLRLLEPVATRRATLHEIRSHPFLQLHCDVSEEL